jgi:hypothetical protein
MKSYNRNSQVRARSLGINFERASIGSAIDRQEYDPCDFKAGCAGVLLKDRNAIWISTSDIGVNIFLFLPRLVTIAFRL